MILDQETRKALLTGVVDGHVIGWPDASTAPLHFQERIIEIRHALVEKREAPAPTREYIQAAEKRSLLSTAKGLVKRVFSPSTDAEIRLKLEQQGEEIRKQAEELRKNKRRVEDSEEVCPTCGQPFEDDENDNDNDERSSPVDAELRLKAKQLGQQIRRDEVVLALQEAAKFL
jgi:hypothetical protein